jgi:hypothetical protein
MWPVKAKMANNPLNPSKAPREICFDVKTSSFFFVVAAETGAARDTCFGERYLMEEKGDLFLAHSRRSLNQVAFS